MAEPTPERIAELEDAVRLREEQLAVIAHDLRGPLSPLMLLLQRVRDQVTAAGDQPITASSLRPQLDAVARRLEQYVDQIGKLLDGSRLESTDLVIQREPLELASMTRDIVEELRGALLRPPAITVSGAAALTGKWDRHGIDQIVRNLVSNAMKFGGDGPIEIRVEGEDEAILTVRDHGPGIPPEAHARIFDKHVKLAGGRGFGLGLWIVKRMAEAMGGSVSVDSGAGQGTTFKVVLPRSGP